MEYWIILEKSKVYFFNRKSGGQMSKAKSNKSDEANDQETLSTQDLFKMLMEMRQQDREENQRREEREARWREESVLKEERLRMENVQREERIREEQ